MAIYNEDTDPNIKTWEEQNKKTINYKVVFEIEVDADSPLEAAKKTQQWLQDNKNDWQFYVQPCDKSEDVFSVDLMEDDEDAVLEVDNYIPMIK